VDAPTDPDPNIQQPEPLPPEQVLAEIEAATVALARLAGEEIARALERGVQVEYKTDAKGEAQPTDPVSEVDHHVEALIRERVGSEFGDHGIIGEEVDEHADGNPDFLWVVDPLDGTTNFVNGFPLYSSAIGVLYRGIPVAGATWCSTSGALGPGVYHAHRGGGLSLDGNAVASLDRNPGLKRRLAAAPGGAPGRTAQWDNRVTGSAALECAYVAAGIFTSARFAGLRIWDLASGLVLMEAAGRETWMRTDGNWHPFERFEPPARVREDRAPTLRDWSQPLIVGTGEAVHALIPERKSFWQKARQLILPGTGTRQSP
jgi:myo-inositol-1(or 4)-monophosphatase